MFPQISVIIPTYNSKAYIARALQSVFDQAYPAVQIIVVDDGSTDNTAEILAPYTDRIHLITQANAGSAVARNTGLAQATGEYVALLDADDWFLPGKFHKQAAMLQARPSLGAVHSGWRIVDAAGTLLSEVQPWGNVPKLNLISWAQWRPVKMGAMLYRRHWLQKVGFFDPALRHSQDVDLMLRLALAGCPMVWLYEPTLCYRHHPHSTIRSQAVQHPQYALAALDKFFARPDLPPMIRRQEAHIRYYQLLWEAWHLYRSGYAAEGAPYLQQSLPYSPYPVGQTVQDWLRNYARWSADDGSTPLALKQMWPHFQKASGLAETAWQRVAYRLDWWLEVWWHYLQEDYDRARCQLALYNQLSAIELVLMVQFFAIFSPNPVTLAMIARFWQDVQQTGLAPPAEHRRVTALYLTLFAQALLDRQARTAVPLLAAALRAGWHPRMWPVWLRFLRTGWLVLTGRRRQAVRLLLHLP